MPRYTLKQRFIYDSMRHSVPLLIIIVTLALLSIFADPIWLQDTLHVITAALPRIGVLVSAWLLVTKFVFAKIDVQERIKHDPLAVSIFVGFLFVGIAITL